MLSHMMMNNVHSLIHLAPECLTHGPLDVFSAFPFENFLEILKKKIRSPKNALAQLIKRISELNALGRGERGYFERGLF